MPVMICGIAATMVVMIWGRAWTVSYTHLDVYKRQGKGRPPAGPLDRAVLRNSGKKLLGGIEGGLVNDGLMGALRIVDVYKRQSCACWTTTATSTAARSTLRAGS